ncbi:U3 small nucleolar RNA-associated protein 14 homolog A-like isoform X1 [Mytilus californianus]|uniref:U3 small nucleolar RNA-associated protein 14 homolog A-like isoform X1 n=1 Tax=Mytilus californianus TaxID=6549 RepID=UPI002246C483|nr:U3 small nucleolar RNA-associated protein 14 homolog A-like isoform X1 [Mytilus californianus]XP_052088939.1 U3 small nucleolar RNA-associated protein 14 homolog A-like isoform X1 [Mytilus californianus]
MELFQEQADISASEDEDGDDRNHLKLLDAISSLDGKKKTRLHERTVHASQISEFNFTAQTVASKINISELMGTLSSSKIKRQLKSVEDSKQVVSVPLPRHQKEKLERSVAYGQTKEVVDKWDSIVQKNRKAEQLRFPLERPVLKLHTVEQQAKVIKPRTSLEVEVASLLKGSENVVSNKQELTPAEEKALKAMSLEEAGERLAELRKHRALLSYKETKARWRNKIKSKKYHRVLRKEKMKNEKKSLDELAKTDPDAYMEKVTTADKQRVEERMSLKHRGGSKYMKKKMIYGKYDDQARQTVQEMIQKNKELTQKAEVVSDSESDAVSMNSEDEMNMLESAVSASENPWMKGSKLSKPSGYEKIEEVKNEDKILLPIGSEDESENTIMLSNVVQKVIIEDKNNLDGNSDNVDVNFTEIKGDKNNDNLKTEMADDVKQVENVQVPKKGKKRKKEKNSSKNINAIDNIDDLFKDFESSKESQKGNTVKKTIHEKIMKSKKDSSDLNSTDGKESKKMKRKRRRMEKQKEREIEKAKLIKKDEKVESEEETFISEKLERRTKLDDFEGDLSDDEIGNEVRKGRKKQDESEDENDGKKFEVHEDVYVDPKKLMTLESKIDKSQMPDMIVDDNDIDNEEQQKLAIAQAFADDDVIEEFSQEKKKVENRDQPKDIDLTLPGWGEWGGVGVKVSKRKKKRFVIKAPPALPRKDRNLGNVIISEQKDKSIAKYQVSDLPFPYVSVKQFEQSIRAPIGKTWNPETAYKQLVKPKIVTKLGTIITPIDKEETFKKEKFKRKADLGFTKPSNEAKNFKSKKRKKQ